MHPGLIQLDETARRYLLGPKTMTLGPKTMTLGPKTMTLGPRHLARLDVSQLDLPRLHELSAETNETATLSLRTGDTRIYVDQVTPVREVIISVTIGVPFPLTQRALEGVPGLPADEQV